MSASAKVLLAPFLIAAKTRTYAADDERQLLALDDGGLEASFALGELRYRDRWYGGASFSGQELVWHAERPCWSMTFHGTTAADAPAEFFHFHKQALRRVPPEAPWRGPALHREGDFLYVNDWSGTLARFRGVERAFLRQAEIYRLEYQGGLLD
ncbi:MAG: DUF5680 domain-containing protein [Deltaproteobacteria bacterium]